MLNLVWTFLSPIVVDLAIRVGLPEAMKWLLALGLPQWLASGMIALAKSAIDQIAQVHADPLAGLTEKKLRIQGIRAKARSDMRKHCTGPACAPDTKGLG